jgi:hypothetical protein
MTVDKPTGGAACASAPASHDETGARFTHVYLRTTEMLQDSKRARVRVAALFSPYEETNLMNILAHQVEMELGVRVPYNGGYRIKRFIEDCDLNDFLDFFSIITTNADTFGKALVDYIRNTSQRIFREERLRYVINANGGVRFSADAAFETHVQATIKNLSRPEFKAAAAAYDACLTELAGAPPDRKAAIRHIFEAVEILFKMLHRGVPRLGDSEIKQNLVPLLVASDLDPTALQASKKVANSLADWVNAAHFYRHGQVSEEPVQPPFSLAVLLVDQGASFIRWLAELNVGGKQ